MHSYLNQNRTQGSSLIVLLIGAVIVAILSVVAIQNMNRTTNTADTDDGIHMTGPSAIDRSAARIDEAAASQKEKSDQLQQLYDN
jgi:Tfp pilus assembly protein PilE